MDLIVSLNMQYIVKRNINNGKEKWHICSKSEWKM